MRIPSTDAKEKSVAFPEAPCQTTSPLPTSVTAAERCASQCCALPTVGQLTYCLPGLPFSFTCFWISYKWNHIAHVRLTCFLPLILKHVFTTVHGAVLCPLLPCRVLSWCEVSQLLFCELSSSCWFTVCCAGSGLLCARSMVDWAAFCASPVLSVELLGLGEDCGEGSWVIASGFLQWLHQLVPARAPHRRCRRTSLILLSRQHMYSDFRIWWSKGVWNVFPYNFNLYFPDY